MSKDLNFFAAKSGKIDLEIVRYGPHAAGDRYRPCDRDCRVCKSRTPRRVRRLANAESSSFSYRQWPLRVSDRARRRLRHVVSSFAYLDRSAALNGVFFFNRIHRFRAFVACTKVVRAAFAIFGESRTFPRAHFAVDQSRHIDSRPAIVARFRFVVDDGRPEKTSTGAITSSRRLGVRSRRSWPSEAAPVDVTVILVCYRYRYYSRIKVAVRVSRFVVKRYVYTTHVSRFS